MPTYQYACTECNHAFEQFQSFSDDALTVCPQCEGRLRKKFNAVGVVFKGSGFYRNDSRADVPSPSGAATSDAKTESAASSSDSGSSGDSGSSDSGNTSGESSGPKADSKTGDKPGNKPGNKPGKPERKPDSSSSSTGSTSAA